MKAILMHETGGPEVLAAANVDDPAPRRGHDLLVRLHAAGLNPVDTKLRSKGTFYPERMPAILGCDGAGVVEKVGPHCQRFQVGDEVYFCNGGIGGDPGNYAHFTLVDERFVARKPRSLSFVEAAAAPLVLITAWEALFDRARLKAGQTCLIHGGAGGVGHVAIQLARYHGTRVATTVSDEEKANFVRDLGAEPINYREQGVAEAARKWSDGGVHMVLDTVGGDVLAHSPAAMRPYGDLVTLLQPAPDTDWREARVRNLRLGFELMLTPMAWELDDARIHHGDILTRCATLFDSGDLRIQVADTFPLTQAADAHRRLEQGGMIGKLVLETD